MHAFPQLRLRLAAAAMLALLLGACTSLQRAELPPEPALAPSHAPFWQEVTAHETDNWFYLLNEGEEALEWLYLTLEIDPNSVVAIQGLEYCATQLSE